MKISEKDNFSYLLISIIFLLFSSACIDQFMPGYGQSFVVAATILTMMIGIWSIKSKKHIFTTGLGLLVTTVVISIFVELLDVAELDFVHIILLLLFFILTLKPASEQALFSGRITGNNIIGSVCIFFLLGLIWTMFYLLLAEFIPNAFSGIELSNWKRNFPDFIYFSFVTLTTLGFGDILPASPLSRFLVYMESVVGVFYMAVVVSSLIGAKIPKGKTP